MNDLSPQSASEQWLESDRRHVWHHLTRHRGFERRCRR
jgi:taurine-pyruvate aminotransferase